MEDETVVDAAATGEEDISSSEITKAPEAGAPKSTLEAVKAKRAETRAASENAPKPKVAASPKGDEASKAEGEEKTAKTTEPAPYSDEELATELETKDLRDLDPKRLPPAVKKTLDVLQAAERKKHTALNAKSKELDDLIAKAKGITEKPAAPKAEEEDEGLPVTKEELRAMFRSKAGREFIAEVMAENGFDPEDAKVRSDQRFMQSAIADAAGEVEELQNDKSFFDDTVKAIRENAKWAKVARESSDKLQISLTFQAAAMKVKADRAGKVQADAGSEAAKKAKEIEDRRKQKEEANLKPSSKAAGAPKKPTTTPGAKLTTLEIVQQQRAASR